MKKADALNILGLTGSPTDEEIKAAHRKQIRKHHPDRFVDPTQKKAAEEKTKLINEARDVLTNGTWEPDFGPRNPYYRPGTSGGSSTGGSGYGGYGSNPFVGGFGDISLEELLRQVAEAQRAGGTRGAHPGYTYVWTSWDNAGRARTQGTSASNTQGSPRTGYTQSSDPFDPFGGFSPFDIFSEFFGGSTQRTREDFKKQALHQRNTFFKYMSIKLLVVVVCLLFSNLFLASALYTLGSIGYAFLNKTHPLARVMIIPALLIGIPVLLSVMRLGWFIMVLVAGIAVLYDIREASTLIRVANSYKD